MSISDVDLIIDSTVDTSRMAPEDDFAPVGDPSVPRKAPIVAGPDPSITNPNAPGGLPATFTQQPAPAPPPQDIQFSDPEDQGVYQNSPHPGSQETEPEYESDDEFADELLNAAGLTKEQAEQFFPDSDSLRRAVTLTDMQFVQQGSAVQPAAPLQPQQDIVVEPKEADWELPPPKEQEEWGEDTKAIVKVMETQTKQLLAQQNAQIVQQQNAMKQLLEQTQATQRRSAVEEFDSLVNSLPDEYGELLGKGTIETIQHSPIHFQQRRFLQETMQKLELGLQTAGRTVPPMDELMIRSLGVMYPDQYRASIQRQVVDEVETRQQELGTHRPTRRAPPPRSPRDQAAKRAEQWYRENAAQMNMDYHDPEVL